MTDHTIPADKLRKAREWANKAISRPRDYDEIDVLVAEVIMSLPEPPLPTLADMTPDERLACVGMWCDNLASTAQEPAPVVLAFVQGRLCWVLHTDLHGEWSCFSLGSVSPRVDLPRAWNPDGTPAQEPDVSKSAPNIDTSTPHADPIDTTPEPRPGEAWLIEDDEGGRSSGLYKGGGEWIILYAVGDMAIKHLHIYDPALIARMVPETPHKVLVTEADYRNAPTSTVVREEPHNFHSAIERVGQRGWRDQWGNTHSDAAMAGTPRTVLWEPEGDRG